MNNRSRNLLLAGISTVSLFLACGSNAYAADAPAVAPATPPDAAAELDTLIVTARGKPRTVLDSAVPVDSFSEADLKASTFTDTNDILKTLVPSYTLAREPISDGATFIRPASLRGLPTDKTLFMVNGKRRHRSALVSIGGTGAQAPDAATIPASALKNVVVTRDGAGAQYGSDAIAGVIDFQLKDSPSGGSLTAQYGQYYLGDGEDVLVTGNLGLPIGDKGFVNGTFEYTSQNQVNRGKQYCNKGIPNQSAGFCVADYAAANPAYGALIHDYVQKWGQPDAEATRGVLNTGYEFSEAVSVYAFANYSKSSATEYFNYRPPVSNAVNATPIRKSDGSLFQFSSIFPAGFTPMFGGDITDYSLAGGLKGKFSNGLTYDISGRYGNDKLSYTLWDTVNPSMGPDSPQSFYVGSLISTESAANADFAYDWAVGGFATPVTVNFGAEYRKEGYEIEAGDVPSYKAGTWAVPDPFGFCSAVTHTPTAAGAALPITAGLNCANYKSDATDGFAGIDPVYNALAVGSNGAPGSPPDYSGKLTRDSYAGYVETSANITEAWFLDLALRGEHFSDFGGTVNGKIATQYQVSDAFGIRGSIGTGFRAPTPGQLFTTNVSTRVENGAIIASGLFPATNPVAQYMGAKELKPEKSLNIALGFTATPMSGLSLTVDAYEIQIDDQFYATTPITVTPTIRAALVAANVPGAATIGQVQFYQNAFDSTTWGVDVVATYKVDWENGQSTAFTASGNVNKFVIDKVFSNQFFDGEGVYDFKHAAPAWRAVLSANHEVGKFQAIGRLNIWGPYKNMFSVGNPVIQKFDTEAFVDLELSYHATDTYTVSLGARNLFANYPAPDLTGESATNGRIYRSDSIVDWQGGFWYLKASAAF
ncbi:TonB-dependent receptor [Caulobacter sp. Root487D2Y]|uniref:TonB-dependent receptor plug domain-containing protein n=1 Tax=Caulobacter sp. Root487D2Y TaxID=1736547 RepID=UPI0006F205FD|nr:TonB-dependent receptor [Caulobacter sp. Root487D2Y]KQY31009.1 TonB-dependent receptor [Caulobacter sp. Root487D2Y]